MYVDGTKMLIPLEDGIGNVIAKTKGTPILPLWVESVQCRQEEWEILRVLNYGKLQTQAGNPHSTSQVVNIRLMIQGIYILRISVQFIYCTCIILQLKMTWDSELSSTLLWTAWRVEDRLHFHPRSLFWHWDSQATLTCMGRWFSFNFWREHFHPKSQSHQRGMYLPFCCITMAGSSNILNVLKFSGACT